jgi:hypothetical protein
LNHSEIFGQRQKDIIHHDAELLHQQQEGCVILYHFLAMEYLIVINKPVCVSLVCVM